MSKAFVSILSSPSTLPAGACSSLTWWVGVSCSLPNLVLITSFILATNLTPWIGSNHLPLRILSPMTIKGVIMIGQTYFTGGAPLMDIKLMVIENSCYIRASLVLAFGLPFYVRIKTLDGLIHCPTPRKKDALEDEERHHNIFHLLGTLDNPRNKRPISPCTYLTKYA